MVLNAVMPVPCFRRTSAVMKSGCLCLAASTASCSQRAMSTDSNPSSCRMPFRSSAVRNSSSMINACMARLLSRRLYWSTRSPLVSSVWYRSQALMFLLRIWEKLFENAPDAAVTLTGRRFEASALQDCDLSAAVADQPRLLKRITHDVHAGTPHTQHHRQELLC